MTIMQFLDLIMLTMIVGGGSIFIYANVKYNTSDNYKKNKK